MSTSTPNQAPVPGTTLGTQAQRVHNDGVAALEDGEIVEPPRRSKRKIHDAKRRKLAKEKKEAVKKQKQLAKEQRRLEYQRTHPPQAAEEPEQPTGPADRDLMYNFESFGTRIRIGFGYAYDDSETDDM